MRIVLEISECTAEEMSDVVHSLHTGTFCGSGMQTAFRRVYEYGTHDALRALEELDRCVKQRAQMEREAANASPS